MIPPAAVMLFASQVCRLENIGEDVDLSGEWWGVIVFEPRRFHRCDSQQQAELVGLQLGEDLGVAVWLEANGHPSARLLGSFR